VSRKGVPLASINRMFVEVDGITIQVSSKYVVCT